jgi:uncharacterized membrane protein
VSSRTQLLLSAAFGLAAGVPVGLVTGADFGALAAWDGTVAAYVTLVWSTVWWLDAGETKARAEREDPTRAIADVLLLSAAVASLVAVGLALANASQGPGSVELVHLWLGLGSVVLSWLLVHTVFALRYARLYYEDPDGGVDFNQREAPTYGDFAYLAFTIGMTFQVSDTDLQKSSIRRTALRHALLSYMFGTGILAATINLVANLTSQ